MTPEERQRKFLELLQEAQEQTGIRLQISLNSRSFGSNEMLQIEPVLNLIVEQDWMPPPTSKAEDGPEE